MAEYRKQVTQEDIEAEFIVRGVADWRECFEQEIELYEPFASLCGGSKVPLMTYVRREAEINDQSFERSVVTAFLNLGYQLEEMEVQFAGPNREDWGVCVWYKEHSAYQEPIPELFTGTRVTDPSFFHAMWRTEHAGDQQWGIYSTQMIASTSILPHKTLIYRRVVFSPPVPDVETQAA